MITTHPTWRTALNGVAYCIGPFVLAVVILWREVESEGSPDVEMEFRALITGAPHAGLFTQAEDAMRWSEREVYRLLTTSSADINTLPDLPVGPVGVAARDLHESMLAERGVRR